MKRLAELRRALLGPAAEELRKLWTDLISINEIAGRLDVVRLARQHQADKEKIAELTTRTVNLKRSLDQIAEELFGWGAMERKAYAPTQLSAQLSAQVSFLRRERADALAKLSAFAIKETDLSATIAGLKSHLDEVAAAVFGWEAFERKAYDPSMLGSEVRSIQLILEGYVDDARFIKRPTRLDLSEDSVGLPAGMPYLPTPGLYVEIVDEPGDRKEMVGSRVHVQRAQGYDKDWVYLWPQGNRAPYLCRVKPILPSDPNYQPYLPAVGEEVEVTELFNPPLTLALGQRGIVRAVRLAVSEGVRRGWVYCGLREREIKIGVVTVVNHAWCRVKPVAQ